MDKDDYKEHRKNSFTQWAYSMQRIDLLVISISGGGIYVCLETLKYSLEHPISALLFLKIIGSVFIVAIISNFISQYCAVQSCKYDLYSWDERIKEQEHIQSDTISNIWECTNSVFNIISAISMLLALIGLIIFFFVTF